MIKKIIFKHIHFSNYNHKDFNKIIKKKGLFLFPSGPGLASINKEYDYHRSLVNADFVFFDSGYFVFLLKILKKIRVEKFSGFLFIKFFFNFLSKNFKTKIVSVDPNSILSKSNYNYILNLGLKEKNLINYIAPKYKKKKIVDKKLLKIINKTNPDFVLINIGGNVQEILGNYLKINAKRKTRIICTGAAISFFTGDQAPINQLLDKFFLGWFIRILYNPKIFLLRYIKTFKLFFIVLSEKIIVK